MPANNVSVWSHNITRSTSGANIGSGGSGSADPHFHHRPECLLNATCIVIHPDEDEENCVAQHCTCGADARTREPEITAIEAEFEQYIHPPRLRIEIHRGNGLPSLLVNAQMPGPCNCSGCLNLNTSSF